MKSSSGKGPNAKECKESCQTTTGCKSITYFDSGWCGHFSTLCTETKWSKKAVSHRWIAVSDTTGKRARARIINKHNASLQSTYTRAHTKHIDVLVSATEATTALGVAHIWIELGFNIECDTSAGEAYMKSSSGRGSNLKQCKESCQTTAGCKSITYFERGWCGHFSTLCTETKWSKKAVSYRWSAVSDAAGQFALF